MEEFRRDPKVIELVLEHRALLKKAREATTEEERKRYRKLAEEKHDEIIIYETGDKNFKRFNSI